MRKTTIPNTEIRELTADEPEMRALTADELDMVSGGTCIEIPALALILAIGRDLLAR